MSNTNKNVKKNEISTIPPKYLGETAKEMYRTLAKYLKNDGKLDKIDENLVVLYASAYEMYRNAYDDILDHGISQEIFHTVISPKGEVIGEDSMGFKRNPATLILSDSLAKLSKIGSELGLSPKSRADIMNLKFPDYVGNLKKVSQSMNVF
ncbi:MAG: phage terminase small subunit P27 family [Oenococcus oeni]|uniref:phage terminase small subunit P27 family n=1 Tax=Oenococcus oeni TaxID=1247 RepID=UPI0008F90243|nr:phage terminase small subunit P27 family [Oenococcus oeni]OIM22370.1 HNH endonuclease [Oenococcus oeni]SYW05462.1 conserved hypothetical protein [Oenococcus oeni]